LYNSLDKSQLFAQIKSIYNAGENSTLTGEDIDRLEDVTGKEYAEVNIESELIYEYFEPTESIISFKTTTLIKDDLEGRTNQHLSIKRIGMALRESGFIRTKKNGVFGYLIREKIHKNENEVQEELPF
jgi:hypothetical protein